MTEHHEGHSSDRRPGPPVAMTIAGSDSGAGAGVQADLKAMSALGVFATTVVTAVTAQNTSTVSAVHPVPTEIVDAQITAVLDDFAIGAVKTGMLATEAIVEVVAAHAAAGSLVHLVVDPVLVASTGRLLLEPRAIDAYRTLLLPHALIVTPNLYEAHILAGAALDDAAPGDIASMGVLAERIGEHGPTWVLVKGGHLPGVHEHDGRTAPDQVADVLWGPNGLTILEGARVETANNHGTGCSLASATAALLAWGLAVPEAVAGAKEFVNAALVGAAGWHLGAGHGPLDPFGWSTHPIPPRTE